MGGLIAQLLTLLCGSTLTLVLFTLTSVLQNLPMILDLIGRGISSFLRISFQSYHFLLEYLLPRINVNPPSGIWLISSTTVISLIIFFSLTLVSQFPINGWTIGIAATHGLYVGFAWDKLASPNGLHLGRPM